MDIGICSKNTRQKIIITELAETLTPEICSALPAFHAFTSIDYTPAFLCKGKANPLKLMESNEVYTKAFTQYGS